MWEALAARAKFRSGVVTQAFRDDKAMRRDAYGAISSGFVLCRVFVPPLVSYRTLVNLSNFLFAISRLICIYATFIFPPRSACDRYVRLTLAFRTTKK